MGETVTLLGLAINTLGAVILAGVNLPYFRSMLSLLYFLYPPYPRLWAASASLVPDISAPDDWISENTPLEEEEWDFVKPIPEDETNRALWDVIRRRILPDNELKSLYLVASEKGHTRPWSRAEGELPSYPVVELPGEIERTRPLILVGEIGYEDRFGNRQTTVAKIGTAADVKSWIEKQRRRSLTKLGMILLAVGFLVQIAGILA